MGIYIGLQPMISLGLAFYPLVPAIEIAIGPLFIIFGDLENLGGFDDDD